MPSGWWTNGLILKFSVLTESASHAALAKKPNTDFISCVLKGIHWLTWDIYGLSPWDITVVMLCLLRSPQPDSHSGLIFCITQLVSIRTGWNISDFWPKMAFKKNNFIRKLANFEQKAQRCFVYFYFFYQNVDILKLSSTKWTEQMRESGPECLPSLFLFRVSQT